jgi:hypothetical protein
MELKCEARWNRGDGERTRGRGICTLLETQRPYIQQAAGNGCGGARCASIAIKDIGGVNVFGWVGE